MKIDSAMLRDAEPGDALFEVWAAQLLESGDARGQLVRLSRELSKQPTQELRQALTQLLDAHPEWTHEAREDFTLVFRDGFVAEMRARTDKFALDESAADDDDEAFDEDDEDDDDGDDYQEAPRVAILNDAITNRLERLYAETPINAEGNHGCWGNHEETIEALLSRPRPWLRSLELDGRALTRSLDVATGKASLCHWLVRDMHDAEIKVGDLSSLWRVAPRLEHLVIAQAVTDTPLGDIDAPELRTLVLGMTPLSAASLDAIARAKLAKLTRLELRLDAGEDDEPLPLDQSKLRATLSNPSLRALDHLGLLGVVPQERHKASLDTTCVQNGDAVIAALLESPLVGRLRTLDLGGLLASEASWAALVRAAPRLKLDELHLWRMPSVSKARGLAEAFTVKWRPESGIERE